MNELSQNYIMSLHAKLHHDLIEGRKEISI